MNMILFHFIIMGGVPQWILLVTQSNLDFRLSFSRQVNQCMTSKFNDILQQQQQQQHQNQRTFTPHNVSKQKPLADASFGR